jgi:hypothetical protein
VTADTSAALTESVTDSSIVLPSDWLTLASWPLGSIYSGDTATVSVTLTASSPGASGSQTVSIRSSGLNSAATPTIIARSIMEKVQWNAVVCDNDAPAVTHTIGSPSFTSGSDTFVTSATTLGFDVDETTNGGSLPLSACTVSAAGGSFACGEGSNNYTLGTLAPLSVASAPADGPYLSSASATDKLGNNGTDSFTVILDRTAPTFGACTGEPFLLGSGNQSVSITADDGTGSGVNSAASTLSGSVDTTSVGTKTVNYAAKDNLGNTASTSCTYSVNYDFHGFFSPVDGLNKVKAGQGIPVKFDLGGDQGLGIFASSYPKSFKIDCDTSADQDSTVATVAAGNSSLNYDGTVNPGIGQYIYVWKTDKGWAGTCRQLDVLLTDGTTHSAKFSFTK